MTSPWAAGHAGPATLPTVSDSPAGNDAHLRGAEFNVVDGGEVVLAAHGDGGLAAWGHKEGVHIWRQLARYRAKPNRLKLSTS